MWIRDTLSLTEIECSQAFYAAAQQLPGVEILSPPTALQFDEQGDLVERFEQASHPHAGS